MGSRRTELRRAEGALMGIDLDAAGDMELAQPDATSDRIKQFLNTCSEAEIAQLLDLNA
ncbi:hypothetical protein [Sorangium sp. So ce406]|uniref:hypothetical protein n=1 Tax=unclassified Sorangium TaxID=2621164 RepID=UPI003F5BCAE1